MYALRKRERAATMPASIKNISGGFRMKHVFTALLLAGSIGAAQAQDLIPVELSLGDISLIGEGMAYEALKKDKVDAFIGSEIYYGMADKQGFKDLADITPLKISVVGSGINAEREWLKNNREAARRFVKASVDAYAFMKKNKEATLKALEKLYKGKDRAEQEKM